MRDTLSPFILALSLGAFVTACDDRGSISTVPAPSASALPAIAPSAPSAAVSAPSPEASTSAAPSASPHTSASVEVPVTPTPNVARPNDREGPVVVAWRPNGRAFAVGLGKKVSIVPIANGEARALPDRKTPVQALVFSVKGDRLAAVEEGGDVHVWDPSSGKLIADLSGGPPGEVTSIAFSDDGAKLAVASSAVAIWDVGRKKKLCALEESWGFQMAFTRDLGSLVTTGNGQSARWDAATCAKKATGFASTGGTFGSWVSPDGKYVAAAAPDGHGLELFDARGFQGVEKLAKSFGCKDHVGPARFSRDGEILLVSGTYQWFRSFRVDSRKTIASYDVPRAEEVSSIVFFDDGERLLVVRGDKGELVSATSKVVAYTLELKGATTFDISWDNHFLLGAGAGAAHVWDAATGKLVRSSPLPR